MSRKSGSGWARRFAKRLRARALRQPAKGPPPTKCRGLNRADLAREALDQFRREVSAGRMRVGGGRRPDGPSG